MSCKWKVVTHWLRFLPMFSTVPIIMLLSSAEDQSESSNLMTRSVFLFFWEGGRGEISEKVGRSVTHTTQEEDPPSFRIFSRWGQG